MNTWRPEKKTIPPQETQLELPLPHNSENTDDVTEEQVKQQIGQLLTQTSYFLQLSRSLVPVVQYNLGTPVTVEAMSYASWVMATHLMSTCDLLKTLISTSQPSLLTTQSKEFVLESLDMVMALIDEVTSDIFGSVIRTQ